MQWGRNWNPQSLKKSQAFLILLHCSCLNRERGTFSWYLIIFNTTCSTEPLRHLQCFKCAGSLSFSSSEMFLYFLWLIFWRLHPRWGHGCRWHVLCQMPSYRCPGHLFNSLSRHQDNKSWNSAERWALDGTELLAFRLSYYFPVFPGEKEVLKSLIMKDIENMEFDTLNLKSRPSYHFLSQWLTFNKDLSYFRINLEQHIQPWIFVSFVWKITILKENGQESKFVQILVSIFGSGLSFIGNKCCKLIGYKLKFSERLLSNHYVLYWTLEIPMSLEKKNL